MIVERYTKWDRDLLQVITNSICYSRSVNCALLFVHICKALTNFLFSFSAHVIAARHDQRAINASVAAAHAQATSTFVPGRKYIAFGHNLSLYIYFA